MKWSSRSWSLGNHQSKREVMGTAPSRVDTIPALTPDCGRTTEHCGIEDKAESLLDWLRVKGLPDVITLGTQVTPWVLVGEHGLWRTALRTLDVEHGRPQRNSHTGSLVKPSRTRCSKGNTCRSEDPRYDAQSLEPRGPLRCSSSAVSIRLWRERRCECAD